MSSLRHHWCCTIPINLIFQRSYHYSPLIPINPPGVLYSGLKIVGRHICSPIGTNKFYDQKVGGPTLILLFSQAGCWGYYPMHIYTTTRNLWLYVREWCLTWYDQGGAPWLMATVEGFSVIIYFKETVPFAVCLKGRGACEFVSMHAPIEIPKLVCRLYPWLNKLAIDEIL